MAIADMKKIQIVGMKKELDQVLTILQDEGVMEVEQMPLEEIANFELKAVKEVSIAPLEADLNNVGFAIDFLHKKAPKGTPKRTAVEREAALKILENGAHQPFVEECKRLEEKSVADAHRVGELEKEKALLTPWAKMDFTLDSLTESQHLSIFVGMVPKQELEALTKRLREFPLSTIEEFEEKNKIKKVAIAVEKKGVTLEVIYKILAEHKFQKVDLPHIPKTPKERLGEISDELATLKKEQADIEERITFLAKNELPVLHQAHDALVWKIQEAKAFSKVKGSDYCFIVTGWVLESGLPKVTQRLSTVSQMMIEEIEPNAGEQKPVVLKNNGLFRPFEFVTNMYGVPSDSDVDPTPFLAGFFIIFFATCLTDSGYGLVLFLLFLIARRFMKSMDPSTDRLTKLLMWGGLVTAIFSIPFGGYFGMTTDQAPAFMSNDGWFLGQLINPMSAEGAVAFLIMAMAMGVVHVLAGVTIGGFWKIKQGKVVDGILDNLFWVFFVLVLITFGLSKMGVFLTDYAGIFANIAIGCAIVAVLTQGRSKNGILGKLLSGILSLYSLVAYMGDILSYSRLMALGLATGVIAFSVNTIAGIAIEMVPYAGYLLALLILIGGHTVNIALNTLGAFIHSGRLQFVEFFGKFLEAGGRRFDPLKREKTYTWEASKNIQSI